MWEIGSHLYRNGDTSICFKGGEKEESQWHNSCRSSVPDHVTSAMHSLLFMPDFRWDETHPLCEKEFALLSLLTQTLISSRHTFSGAPKIMFSKTPGEPVIQLTHKKNYVSGRQSLRNQMIKEGFPERWWWTLTTF